MHHPHLLAPALFSLGSALLLCLPRAPGELKLKDSDHRSLSKLVGEYYKAIDEQKGIQVALDKALKQVGETQKRLRGEDLLAAVGDWEQVFWLVQLDRLKGNLKSKGKVDEFKGKAPTEVDVAFAYSLPKTYVDKKGPYPLLLIVPDEGEKAAAHLDAAWNDAALREGALLVAVQLGSNSGVWGTFGSPSEPGGVFSVMSVLSTLQRELAIDVNRTFLAGSGKGFAAAGLTAAAFPHVFTGLIALGDVPVIDAKNFRSLPSLIVRGGEGAKALQAQLGELGFGNSTALEAGTAADVWGWMQKTRRDAYPAQVSFGPVENGARSAYWISVNGIEVSENPRVDAWIDRATNTITVDAQKVADVMISLNDVLVDLSKPVKFVVNGTVHEQTVERNAPDMLRSQYYFGDWGRVFTGYVPQNVP